MNDFSFRNVNVTWPFSVKLQITCFVFHFQALDFVSGDIPFGDDDLKLVESLRVSCWLNTAACCLKLLDYHRAVNLCSKVK